MTPSLRNILVLTGTCKHGLKEVVYIHEAAGTMPHDTGGNKDRNERTRKLSLWWLWWRRDI
jgi:hypothetical protein